MDSERVTQSAWDQVRREIQYYEGELNKLDKKYAMDRMIIYGVICELQNKLEAIADTEGVPHLASSYQIGDKVEATGRACWQGTITATQGRKVTVALTLPGGSVMTRTLNSTSVRRLAEGPKEK